MVSVGKREFLIKDLQEIAAKYGLEKTGTKQSLIDSISTAIEDVLADIGHR